MIFVGDVTDPERMREGVALAKERFGDIRGVFHTAGVIADGLIQTKTQATIEGVFAPKVYGTQVLRPIFRDEPLDFFFLFSSTSTVTGPARASRLRRRQRVPQCVRRKPAGREKA